jgi:hypothetical protein
VLHVAIAQTFFAPLDHDGVVHVATFAALLQFALHDVCPVPLVVLPLLQTIQDDFSDVVDAVYDPWGQFVHDVATPWDAVCAVLYLPAAHADTVPFVA